jgi:hypothetical protein
MRRILNRLVVALPFFCCNISGASDAVGLTAENKHVTPLSTSSYINRHAPYQYFGGERLPRVKGDRVGDARTFFRFSDGSLGFAYHTLLNGPWNATPKESKRGTFRLVKKGKDGFWEDKQDLIEFENSVEGCVHSRKIIVSDFNLDGAPDFAVACQGWDAPPFPGEKVLLVVSQKDGRYRISYLSEATDFYHGMTAGDINGDGYPDLIVTTMNIPVVYINDGAGGFRREASITQFRRAFHVELIDLNGDGKLDLVGGSHEWDDATRIIYNRGDGNFVGSFFDRPPEQKIPPVTDAGTIVDFLYINSIDALFVLRTGGKNNFYKGIWLQKYVIKEDKSTVVFANPSWQHPMDGRPKSWFTWMLEKDGYVVSDHGKAFQLRIE